MEMSVRSSNQGCSSMIACSQLQHSRKKNVVYHNADIIVILFYFLKVTDLKVG
jgi:hypothetical protein